MISILLIFVILCVLGIRYWNSESVQDEPPVLANKLPIVGHGHLFLGGIKFFRSFKELSMECLKNGGLLRIYLGSQKYYVVTDPEDCLTIANSCLQKASIYDWAKPWLGEGLVTGHVVTWKRHRKLLNSMFNQQILSSYIDIFNSQSRRLVDTFAIRVGEVFNHQTFLQSSSLNTVCMISTGANCYSLFNDYQLCMNDMLNILAQRLAHFWLFSNFIFNITSLKQKQDRDVKKLNMLFDSVIKTKNMDNRMEHQLVGAKSRDEAKISDGNVKSFLSLMFELSDKSKCFTDAEIREETNTIISAGYDTTATAITFAMILLGSYPQVQNKVYEEIQEVIGETDRDVAKDDLSKFVYVEAVLKETMRLYPVVSLVARKVDTEVKLKNYTLKPGNDCVLSIWGLHRHEVWGPDADQFRPERWLEPDTLPDLKICYGAFSLGRRSCIGKVYAMMSMKISLVHLMRKYKVKSDITKLVLKLDLMLKPEAGHHIQLELRK